MNAIDLWVLGVFQGEQGGPAYDLVFAVGVLEMLRLGRLAERAGYRPQLADELRDERPVFRAKSIRIVAP